MVEVIKQGLYSSIQDLGRLGYAHIGVPVSGAMDATSALIANTVLGNLSTDAVLEMTFVGAQLKFHTPTFICITGADMSATLNNTAIQLNKKIQMEAGDVLTFASAKNGCRTYVAVSGGFQTEVVLSSRSYYANITKCSVVKKGDVLKISPNYNNLVIDHAKIKTSRFTDVPLLVFEGPEFQQLTKNQQEQLFKRDFTVSNLNNRMAYQLNEILKNTLSPIITSAVLPGTVQLTPNGTLIVLMRDAQTTGGYPRILQLSESAINRLAQKKVNDLIRFKRTTGL